MLFYEISTCIEVKLCKSYYSIPINDLLTEENLQWKNILLLELFLAGSFQ